MNPGQNTTDPRFQPARKNRWVIFALMGLVLVPMMFHNLRGEPDRWRAARIMESWLDGNHQQAIQELTAISKRLPDDHQIKMVLAAWVLEQGRRVANEQNAAEAAQWLQDIPDNFRGHAWRELNRGCLLATDQAKEALASYQKNNPANSPRSVDETLNHKNSLAYYQALAGIDLDNAWRNSNKVIDAKSKRWNDNNQTRFGTSLQANFCAATVLRYQIVELSDSPDRDALADRAIGLLNESIAALEQDYRRLLIREKLLKQNISDNLATVINDAPEETNQGKKQSRTDRKTDEQKIEQTPAGTGLKNEQTTASTKRATTSVKENDAKALAQKKEYYAEAMATVQTLQALIYQDIGRSHDSFANRQKVINLGFDPEMIAQHMPDFRDCVFQLELLAQFLDTRGCVSTMKGDFRTALRDLNLAVMAQRTLVQAIDVIPRNVFQSSLDPREQQHLFVDQPKQTLAVLLQHRSWALRGNGKESQAVEDLAEVRTLDFVPGNYLF